MSIPKLPAARVCAIDSRVVRVERPCAEHVDVEISLSAFPASEPGQFLQLRCSDEPASGAPAATPYLRRPFSIADRWELPGGETRMRILSRAVGVGTRWLDRLSEGAVLNISGPFGRGFRIPDDREIPLVLAGGGVGIPPLLYLARRLRERGHRDVTAVFGATRHDLLPVSIIGEPAPDGRPSHCAALPGEARYPTIVTTDDGSLGMKGFVTHGVEAWRRWRDGDAGSRVPLILACGPERMLDALGKLSRNLGYGCQVCIERHMGCGLGTCLSCVVRVVAPQRPSGWRWALTCTDGPVFERDELWAAPAGGSAL